MRTRMCIYYIRCMHAPPVRYPCPHCTFFGIYHTQNNEKLVSFYINNDDNGYKWCTSTKKIAFLKFLNRTHLCTLTPTVYPIREFSSSIIFLQCPSIFCLICLEEILFCCGFVWCILHTISILYFIFGMIKKMLQVTRQNFIW